MAEQTLKEKTAKGLFWGGLSNGVQQLLGMCFGIVLARILDAEDYGLVGMLAVFSGIAGTIINSGFTVALTNKKKILHSDYNAVFWFTVIVGLICYLVLFLLAPMIAEFYHHPELIWLSRVLFLGFFFSGCASVSYTVLFKQLMVKQQAQIDISAMALSGTVGVVLAIKGYAYWALALQSLTYAISGAVLRFIFAPWKPTFEFNFAPLKGILGFSSKMFLTNIFQQINVNVFSILLGRFYNANQVGYYSQGNKWMTMGYGLVTGMVLSVAQPVFAQVTDDTERETMILRKMLRFGAFVSFPLLLGLAFIAKEFIIITVGEKWLASVPFLQLFCLWGAFGYIWFLYTNLLIAHGKSDIYLKGVVGTAIIQLSVVALCFPLGIYTMVCAYIFVFLISIIWWHTRVSKILNLKFVLVLKDISPYLLFVLFSFFVAWVLCLYISNIYLLLFSKILITGVVYFAVLWVADSKILKESLNFVLRKR